MFLVIIKSLTVKSILSIFGLQPDLPSLKDC